MLHLCSLRSASNMFMQAPVFRHSRAADATPSFSGCEEGTQAPSVIESSICLPRYPLKSEVVK